VKCGEIKRFAHAYLDGEFDSNERVLFEDHLSECDSCREDIQGLAVFGKAVRERAASPRLTGEARTRISARVHAEMSRSSRRFFLMPSAAAAALVMALGAFFIYQGWQAPDKLSHIVEESIAAHEASLPPEVEGSGEAIKGFLASKEEMAPEPPLKESEKTRLLGVRLTRIGKDKALLYRYLHNGQNISVVQLPRNLPASADLPRPAVSQEPRVVFTGARNGHAVTTFESPRFTNTVIGDISEPELLKLVPASL
jgi:hypothetical protein